MLSRRKLLLAATDSASSRVGRLLPAPSSFRRASSREVPGSPVAPAKWSSWIPADSSDYAKCLPPSAPPAPAARAPPIPFPIAVSLQSAGTNPAPLATVRTRTPAPPASRPKARRRTAPLAARPSVGVLGVKQRLGRSALRRLPVPPASSASIGLCSDRQAPGLLPPAQTPPSRAPR